MTKTAISFYDVAERIYSPGQMAAYLAACMGEAST